MREFIRGERAKLSELAAINHIWQVGVAIDAPFFVVDYCCLGLDEVGQVVDDAYLVSYNQPDSPNDAIKMDNASNTGAIFTIYLEHLPAAIRRVVLTATLHKPEMPGGILGAAFSLFGPTLDIGQGHLTLSTPAIDAAVFGFSGEDFGEESTLVLGEFYWRDEWRFVAAGQPLKGDLDVFLRTLTDGPTQVPTPSSQPATAPVVAPPRPAKVIPRAVSANAQPTVLTPTPPKPSTPVLRPVSSPAPSPVPVAIPSDPVVQSITPQEEISKPVILTSPDHTPMITFPQSLPSGGKLQDLIDAAEPGTTLTLMRGEYQGPITIDKALRFEGQGSALWSRVGPVVNIASPNVSLHNFDIEVTVTPDATDESGIALKIETQLPRLELDGVKMRGRINGLGDGDGNWELPKTLDLGDFAPRAENQFRFALNVPTSVKLSSTIEGVSLLPSEVQAGQHDITLLVRDVVPEALIVGFVEVRSASLVRTIRLSGTAKTGVTPRHDMELNS